MAEKLRILGLFGVVAASAGGSLAACDLELDHDVGETASTTADSGGDPSTSGETADSGVLDTGPWDSSTTGDTGVLDTGPWDSSTGGDETTGGIADCSPSDASAPLFGLPWLEVSNRAVLTGPCTVGSIPAPDADGLVQVDLDCTFDGRLDGDDVTALAMVYTLSFTAGTEIPVAADDEVTATVGANQWFGQSDWLILESAGDPSRVVLEAISAIALDPASETEALATDVQAVLGPSGWPSRIAYTAGDSSCAIEDGCGAIARNVTAAAQGAEVVLENHQAASLTVGDQSLEIYVDAAMVLEETDCLDAPNQWFAITAIAAASG